MYPIPRVPPVTKGGVEKNGEGGFRRLDFSERVEEESDGGMRVWDIPAAANPVPSRQQCKKSDG